MFDCHGKLDLGDVGSEKRLQRADINRLADFACHCDEVTGTSQMASTSIDSELAFRQAGTLKQLGKPYREDNASSKAYARKQRWTILRNWLVFQDYNMQELKDLQC